MTGLADLIALMRSDAERVAREAGSGRKRSGARHYSNGLREHRLVDGCSDVRLEFGSVMFRAGCAGLYEES